MELTTFLTIMLGSAAAVIAIWLSFLASDRNETIQKH